MNLDLINTDLAGMASRAGLTKSAASPKVASSGPTKTRLNPKIHELANDALAEFRASSDFASLIADLPGMSLYQLQFRLRMALEGPCFAPMMSKLTKLSLDESDDPSDPLEDFIPNSVSLGLFADAVVIVGVCGSVGYVVNLDASDPAPGIYVGGAADEGLDLGGQVDIGLGFWKQSVKDIGGLYVGAELDTDDGAGVDGICLEKDQEISVIFAGVDAGLQDGLEGVEFYFFEFDVGNAPIYQPGDYTYLVQLQGMTCNDSDGDYDGVFFEFLADDDSTVYRFPAWDSYQMAEAHRDDGKYTNWSVGLIIKFNSSFKLRLHFADVTMADVTITAGDYISNGTFKVTWAPTLKDGHKDNTVNYQLMTVMLKE